jgi:archaellum component FlaG (FlaF/FlaG flagellin family)
VNHIKKVLLLSIVGSILYAQQTTLFLSPQLVPLELPPGGMKTFILTIINESDNKTANIKVYTSDVTETDLGIYKVLDSDTSKWSCAKWIEIRPDSFSLKPREAQEVLCRLRVPRNARGGRYAAIVFELLPEEKKEGAAASIAYRFRLPSFVELTIKGRKVQKRVIITDLEIISASENPRYAARFGKDALIFAASVRNESNIHVFAKGNLTIRNRNKRRIKEVPLGTGRGLILPQKTVKFRSVVAPLPPGEYIAEVTINYDSPSPAIARVPFKIERKKVLLAGGVETTIPLNIDVRPENLEMMVPAGAYRTISFIFKNHEEFPLDVSVSTKAMTFDLEGDVVILDTSSGEWSCADWINLEPSEFTVRPRGVERIKATIRVPEDVSGERYASVVYQITPRDTTRDTLNQIALSLRTTVTLTIPGKFEKKGEIEKIEVNAYKDVPVSLTIYFKNTGNIHLKPRGKATLEVFKKPEVAGEIQYVPGQEYETVGVVNIEPVKKPILPGSTRRIKVDFLHRLPEGKYRIVVRMDYGGETAAEAVKEFIVQ